jgi:hypothetical protein
VKLVRILAGYRDCDLCGKPAEKRMFAVGSRLMREIDLCDRDWKKLQKVMQPYVAASRKPPARSMQGRLVEPAQSSSNPETAKIREWARSRGYHVGERGAISKEIRRAYHFEQQE